MKREVADSGEAEFVLEDKLRDLDGDVIDDDLENDSPLAAEDDQDDDLEMDDAAEELGGDKDKKKRSGGKKGE